MLIHIPIAAPATTPGNVPKAIPTAAPQIALRQTEASEIASEASGVAVITYGLSAFFDGNGVFRRAFEFTGYGFLPSLLGSAVTVPFSIGYLDAISVLKMSVNEFAANPEILPKIILSQILREYVYSVLLNSP